MFHDLLAILKECVPLSIAFIVVFNASYVHMLFLIVEGIIFNCGVDHFFCGSKGWGSFSLFDVKSVARKFSMLFRLLQATMQFMIFFSS
jgi:hypothetical protein